MRIDVTFENHGRESIDFIELKNPLTGETLTLDWDSSDCENGNVYGKGVHINHEGEDEPESETYGNGRIDELRGFEFSSIQVGNLDTGDERTDVTITSITIDDEGELYDVPIRQNFCSKFHKA